MENSDIQMERLLATAGAERWTLVSVQALSRFYKGRTQEVVASWITRQDREAAIADNIAYVDRVVEAVAPGRVPIVFAGFCRESRWRLGQRCAAHGEGREWLPSEVMCHRNS